MRAIPKRDLINIVDSLDGDNDKPIFEDTIKNIFEKLGDEYYYDMGDSYGPPNLTVDRSNLRRDLLKDLGEDIK